MGMCSFVGSYLFCCQLRCLRFYRCVRVESESARVVIVDNLFSVIHAAVADLDGVAIEDFP